MMNTPHYHYSGLLYLSSYQTDFTGGRFHFVRPKYDGGEFQSSGEDSVTSRPTYEDFVSEQIIEPRKGRVVIFTSGKENTHYVERVTSGQRFVLSFW